MSSPPHRRDWRAERRLAFGRARAQLFKDPSRCFQLHPGLVRASERRHHLAQVHACQCCLSAASVLPHRARRARSIATCPFEEAIRRRRGAHEPRATLLGARRDCTEPVRVVHTDGFGQFVTRSCRPGEITGRDPDRHGRRKQTHPHRFVHAERVPVLRVPEALQGSVTRGHREEARAAPGLAPRQPARHCLACVRFASPPPLECAGTEQTTRARDRSHHRHRSRPRRRTLEASK